MTEQEGIEKPGMSKSAKIILLCTLALIIFLSFTMIFMFKHLAELTGSPFVYGAKKTADQNNVNDVMCSCQLVGFANTEIYPYKDPNFFFNSTSIWVPQHDLSAPADLPDFNFSK